MRSSALFACLCILINSTAVGQQRFQVYEEFSSENCPFDAQYNPILNGLLELPANKEKVAKVQYQMLFNGGQIYQSNFVDYQNRINYYSVSTVPSGRRDGKIIGGVHVSNMTQMAIDTQAAIPSAFNMMASHTWNANGDSITATITVQCVSPFAPPAAFMKVRVALVEDLHYTSAPGTNGETVFINLVRRMYPDANGTTVSNVWAPGQIQTYVLTGFVPSYVNKQGETKIVAWIQNDYDKSVEQAARSIPTVTGIKGLNNLAAVRVHPNPARDRTALSFNLLHSSDLRAYVVDAGGRVVRNITKPQLSSGQHTIELSTAGLAAGIYTVYIISEGTNHVQRLVIN